MLKVDHPENIYLNDWCNIDKFTKYLHKCLT